MLNKILTLATLTLALNANALECYSDANCAKKAVSLIKKARGKKICLAQTRTAYGAVKNRQFDGAATDALAECIKAEKSIFDLKELGAGL